MRLEVSSLCAGYGRLQVLHDVSFEVADGEILAVVGSNGAGKTTLLRALGGLVRPTGGSVRLDEVELTGRPAEVMARLGLAHVPENRLCFPSLTVRDNLLLGAWVHRGAGDLDAVLDAFPRLRPRLGQAAGTLSGGEQQMLAIGRALMSRPSALILDEPSTGLAPRVVGEIMVVLRELCSAHRLAVVLVEQNVRAALRVADEGIVLRRGEVVLAGPPAELVSSEAVRHAYLGGAGR